MRERGLLALASLTAECRCVEEHWSIGTAAHTALTAVATEAARMLVAARSCAPAVDSGKAVVVRPRMDVATWQQEIQCP